MDYRSIPSCIGATPPTPLRTVVVTLKKITSSVTMALQGVRNVVLAKKQEPITERSTRSTVTAEPETRAFYSAARMISIERTALGMATYTSRLGFRVTQAAGANTESQEWRRVADDLIRIGTDFEKDLEPFRAKGESLTPAIEKAICAFDALDQLPHVRETLSAVARFENKCEPKQLDHVLRTNIDVLLKLRDELLGRAHRVTRLTTLRRVA